MMIYSIHLDQPQFENIRNGKKSIESRLNDEKRKNILPGDHLEFVSRSTDEKINVEVLELLRFNSFKEMFLEIEPEKFGGQSVKSLLDEIRQFYSEHQEGVHGVVGIHFKLIK